MKKIAIYISIIGFLFSSCTKALDEAAVNKNSPEDVNIAEILPAAEHAITYTVGNQYSIYGGVWAQYWTQGSTASQYLKNEQYTLTNTDQDRPWNQLYAGALNDLKIIKSKSLASKDSQMYAIALVLEAYTFQVLSDAYENIPMTNALDPTNLSPTYDEPQVVYDGLEARLKEASKILKNLSNPTTYSFDLIYGGDATKWLKFANTLLLKVYVRQSYARPAVASAGISANLTGATYITASTDNAMTRYLDALSQRNPLHSSQKQLANFENLKASTTSLLVLSGDADKRIGKFYNGAIATGLYTGFAQGAGRLPTASTANNNYSNIGNLVGGVGGPTAPVILMSNWESMFLQAEAAARGWMGGTAATFYANGIRESHLYCGLTAADATAVAGLHPLSGSPEAQAGLIVAQKWIAMNGTQSFEGYTELRRMSYTLPYGTFPTSAVSNLGAGLKPYRFPIPSTEVSTNSSAPLTKAASVKMWFSK